MRLEELIEKHRPPAGTENDPAGSGALWHLNRNGLMEQALERQLSLDSPTGEWDDAEFEAVITRQVAWEVLSEAQRDGLRLGGAHRHPDPRKRASRV